jgi:acyl-CoA synthetase (AMP-forming)/AMP-acid ligase II
MLRRQSTGADMLVDLPVGTLSEPLTGRRWDRPAILGEVRRRVAGYRRLGMAAADRVFVHHGNSLEFFADLLAIWTLGGCAIPVDPRLTCFQVETLARAAAPRFALWHGAAEDAIAASLADLNVTVLDTAEELAGRGASPGAGSLGSAFSLDQPALILFTSGSTGRAKGVVHTHRTLRARWASLRQHLGLAKMRRTLCLLPTHFGHGLICNCLFPWLSGQDLFILPPFRAQLVADLGTVIEECRITFMSSVPALWRLALKTARPPRTHSLERVACGSAPLSASLWRHIREWTRTADVLNAYGITETASWLAGTTVLDFVPEDGLIGEPWGAVLKILETTDATGRASEGRECAPGEPGHVWVRTPALMTGYLGEAGLTREAVARGWFMTGDIGAIDDRGWLYLRGRERDEINKGGTKVYPNDIDAVAERSEGVLDVCTFAYDDALHGENVGIALVLEEPRDEALRRLHGWMTPRLAKHQMPSRWHLVDEIPRTSRGKVNRAHVAAACDRLAPMDLRRVLAGGLESGAPAE